MKKSNVVILAVVLSGSVLLAAGCRVEERGPGGSVAVTVPGEIYVDSAPPAPIVEVQPAIPGPGFIWIGGDWAWEGGRWRWAAGRWERPPHPGAYWHPGHYEYRGGRDVYARGGWR
jgi:hypothetical protein